MRREITLGSGARRTRPLSQRRRHRHVVAIVIFARTDAFPSPGKRGFSVRFDGPNPRTCCAPPPIGGNGAFRLQSNRELDGGSRGAHGRCGASHAAVSGRGAAQAIEDAGALGEALTLPKYRNESALIKRRGPRRAGSGSRRQANLPSSGPAALLRDMAYALSAHKNFSPATIGSMTRIKVPRMRMSGPRNPVADDRRS